MEGIKKILWIDDDINRFSLMPYIDEFVEQGFLIIRVENPDEIDEQISLHLNDLQCIIVDISMPPGNNISFGEAKAGMQTGLVILKKLVENTALNSIKKVVFTIVDNADVRDFCNSQMPKIPYLQKHKYFTDTLVSEIQKLVQ